MENPFEAYNQINSNEENQGGGFDPNMKGGEDEVFKFNWTLSNQYIL